MFRKARLTGLAALLALAVSAISASAALAEPTFTAASYPSTTSGVQTETYVFTTGMGDLKCSGLTFSGEQKAAASEITLTPIFSGCAFLGLGTVIRLNGCDFSTKVTTSVEENMLYSGTLSVACPAGKSMEFDGASGACILSIQAQSGVGTVEFEDQTGASPEDVLMKVNLSNMKYTLSGSIFCKGSFENGTYKGASTLKSLNNKAMAQSFMVGGK